MRRLPPLNTLPAFEATARLGSVTQAARELGRTHGAVSKQLRTLAEALGYSLFDRDGNALVLTPQGEAFRNEVAEALDKIADAFEQTRAEAPRSLLRLGVSATFASRWLMPRLPRFHARYPGIEIAFTMAGRRLTKKLEFDLVLSWDRLRTPRPGLPHKVVGDVRFALVHAPGYPVTRGPDGIHVETRIVPDTLPDLWKVWHEVGGMVVAGSRDYQFPQTGLVIDAACSGMGVAVLEQRLIEEELQDGRLVAPYGWTVYRDGFYAYPGVPSRITPEAEAFMDWLREIG